MKKPIYIYGAGGLGREIVSLLRALPQWEPAGFYDDGHRPGTAINGLPVVGGLKDLAAINHEIMLVLGIGDPVIKEKLASELRQNKMITFPVLIHPSAILQDHESIALGHGCILGAGCILTTHITLGDHVLVNLNTTIGHDVQLGDYSSVMPGAHLAGEVSVGIGVLIGSGSEILNGITIGERARIGAGSVVTRNIDPGVTVAGVPAIKLKSKQ